MKLIKKIEELNKSIVLNILKIFLQNKQANYPLDANQIKKILILRFDVLGDMIITIPMVDYLKSLVPHAEIDILCSNKNYAIGKNIDGINNAYIYSGKPIFFNELKHLRIKKYDLIISLVFNKTSLSGLIANYINNKAIKVSLLESKRADLYSILYNILLPLENLKGKITLLELQLRMISLMYDKSFDKYKVNKAKLNIESNYTEKAKEFFSNSKTKKIIYNISAGSDYRTFSTKKNIEILSQIIKIFPDYDFYISFYKDDFEKAKMIINSNNNTNLKLLPETNNIYQLIAFIKCCDYVITPDTSIVHIASMFDIPTVIFYSLLGPLPLEWAPFRNQYIQIITKERTSIEKIENSEIIEKIKNFLKFN